MITISKILTFAATACLATPVLATTSGKVMQSGSFLAIATVVPGSSCGWKTVKRKNGSTALELDREKWLSKGCESDRAKYRIVPTPNVAESSIINIGCDYRIFTKVSSDNTMDAQRRTDDLNRQCLSETARTKQAFEDKKALYHENQQKVDEAQSRAEQAHVSVLAAQRAMNSAYGEAMAAHTAKNWPVYRDKMEEYKNKMAQHQIADQTYSGLLAAYESLIASLA